VCRNLNLQSYLIKPIQRLTKYPLLLKDMTEACDDATEKRQITLVQDRMVKIVAQLNEDQRLTENREQLLEIISKFGDKNDKVFSPFSPLNLSAFADNIPLCFLLPILSARIDRETFSETRGPSC